MWKLAFKVFNSFVILLYESELAGRILTWLLFIFNLYSSLLISFSMDFTIVCISMTSSTNVGGGGEFFCICWIVGESATSMESFVDSNIEYLLYVVTPLIGYSF